LHYITKLVSRRHFNTGNLSTVILQWRGFELSA